MRDKPFTRLTTSPTIMASGNSTIVSLENPNELCDRLEILI